MKKKGYNNNIFSIIEIGLLLDQERAQSTRAVGIQEKNGKKLAMNRPGKLQVPSQTL